jgi:hypothetical protein
MLKRLLVILGLSPSLALAQGLTTLAPGATGGGKVLWSAPFSTAGCYASGQTAGASSAISITRTTKGTYVAVDGTTVVECQNNEFRVAPDGLLVEPARSSYALQSATHPKAAEATGAVPVGACVAWHDGTGTMTLATGAATVTGLSCTAVAAGTLCPFTVTVTGTMALTTTAGTTHAQIECPGAFRTSRIVTAGTAVARNADAISATVPAVSVNKWCVAGTFKPQEGRAWVDGGYLWEFGTYSQANDVSVSSGNVLALDTYDATPARKLYSLASTAAGTHRRITCYNAGSWSMYDDGVALSLSPSGAGTGVVGTLSTTLHIGRSSTANTSFGGFIKNLSIWKASKAKEVKP